MNKTVLLAEDDKPIIEVVKIILEGEGHKVLEGSTEKDVLKILSTEKVDIILLDIGLGGTDGTKLAKKIKSTPETATIPIVIVSANNEAEKKAKEAGVEGFLAKPFELDHLLSIVTTHAK